MPSQSPRRRGASSQGSVRPQDHREVQGGEGEEGPPQGGGGDRDGTPPGCRCAGHRHGLTSLPTRCRLLSLKLFRPAFSPWFEICRVEFARPEGKAKTASGKEAPEPTKRRAPAPAKAKVKLLLFVKASKIRTPVDLTGCEILRIMSIRRSVFATYSDVRYVALCCSGLATRQIDILGPADCIPGCRTKGQVSLQEPLEGHDDPSDGADRRPPPPHSFDESLNVSRIGQHRAHHDADTEGSWSLPEGEENDDLDTRADGQWREVADETVSFTVNGAKAKQWSACIEDRTALASSADPSVGRLADAALASSGYASPVGPLKTDVVRPPPSAETEGAERLGPPPVRTTHVTVSHSRHVIALFYGYDMENCRVGHLRARVYRGETRLYVEAQAIETRMLPSSTEDVHTPEPVRATCPPREAFSNDA
ncbi:hypothetical protein THAOC_26869 [Thalassiosira oceanica]|uniref:Uncharacterized protein n=1 Tax=Thalassiosira oceanica TaxID=159749 RepID=K0RXT8_THAOC|nr:hypothetical protein THAOC_26869 [Thalassiosira oceanica]|eukprot:EJK53646.1 hypothetical protein THAOC_26869 [Thalassiosira oceanica]